MCWGLWGTVGPALGTALQAGFKIRNSSLMACQGAQEEPEGRLGGPEDIKTARRGPSKLFYPSLIILVFLLALPGLPGSPSSYRCFETCLHSPGLNLKGLLGA